MQELKKFQISPICIEPIICGTVQSALYQTISQALSYQFFQFIYFSSLQLAEWQLG